MQAVPKTGPDLASLEDIALIELIRQGHEVAVRTLVQRHNRRLFRTARAVLRDDTEAEDVVQDAYLRAFARLDSFRGESSFSTWLTRIALNEAFGRLRKRRNRLIADTETAGQSGAAVIQFPGLPQQNPETDFAREQIRQLLEKSVDELPDPFRVVFILRDIEGMSTEDVATQLCIRPETVKTRLHRARRLIRAALSSRMAAAFSDLFPFDGHRCVSLAGRLCQRLRSAGFLQKEVT